ncbi:fibronectin type III domain-containing protein [Rossellomorea sp. KS-H15a]|uniref:fibronectin type III domain-containing protein n=1 Tax=Rossellomorea sp. KS-H15a TaxID=2963940 RepID=UPI0020C5F4EB|nr:fibronectin type III domain-containing protein [Rossellomorea sp. KS-H15a]UTE77464.1 fibronectin type III domain-containing protein [Rossellomorea sp. KS-H15a]
MAMFGAIHFTSYTGASFNDVENISGTLSAAADFCEGAKNGSDYWHAHCKDNAGGGNGPESGDEDTGEGTDPDNPGHNKDDCEDHTNAACSDKRKITNLTKTALSNSISFNWSNPTDNKFSSIRVSRDDHIITDSITNGQFEEKDLVPATTYTYRIVAIDKSGKSLSEEIVEVTTSEAQEEQESQNEPVTTEEEQPATPPESNEEPEPEKEEQPTEQVVDQQPPSEVSKIEWTRKGNNIVLTWIKPLDQDFTHINIYVEGNAKSIKGNITDSTVNLSQNPNQSITYKFTTVDSSGNESPGTLITVNEK